MIAQKLHKSSQAWQTCKTKPEKNPDMAEKKLKKNLKQTKKNLASYKKPLKNPSTLNKNPLTTGSNMKVYRTDITRTARDPVSWHSAPLAHQLLEPSRASHANISI